MKLPVGGQACRVATPRCPAAQGDACAAGRADLDGFNPFQVDHERTVEPEERGRGQGFGETAEGPADEKRVPAFGVDAGEVVIGLEEDEIVDRNDHGVGSSNHDAQAPDGGKYGRKLQTLRSRREGARVTFARKSVSAKLDPPVDKGLIYINRVVTWRCKELRKIVVGVIAISDSHQHRTLQIAAVTVVKKVALLSLTIR